MLALCAIATALHPQPKLAGSKVLALRGGNLGVVTKVGAGLLGASGAMCYVDPIGNLGNYGIKEVDTSAKTYMRFTGAWQIGLAALLLADDPLKAANVGLWAAAAAIFATIPQNEAYRRTTRA